MVRSCNKSDLKTVTKIENETFQMPWSENMLAMEIYNTDSIFLVDDEKGKIRGYAIMRKLFDEDHILNIAVCSEYRKKGVGKKLLSELLNTPLVKIFFLEVRVSNTPALSLYQSLGFDVISIRKNYYINADGSTEHAYVMRKELI